LDTHGSHKETGCYVRSGYRAVAEKLDLQTTEYLNVHAPVIPDAETAALLLMYMPGRDWDSRQEAKDL
jgi:hypothetical protein